MVRLRSSLGKVIYLNIQLQSYIIKYILFVSLSPSLQGQINATRDLGACKMGLSMALSPPLDDLWSLLA